MPVADVAASFQEAVVDVLTRKAVLACREHGVDDLLIGGGVAANSRLRALAQERCDAAGIRLRVPRPGLCTDNGAMVAALGAQMVRRGRAAVRARPPGRLLDAGRPPSAPERARRSAGGGLLAEEDVEQPLRCGGSGELAAPYLGSVSGRTARTAGWRAAP